VFRDRRQRKRAGQPAVSGGTTSGNTSRTALEKELDDLGL
jgi:hypothetical protein